MKRAKAHWGMIARLQANQLFFTGSCVLSDIKMTYEK